MESLTVNGKNYIKASVAASNLGYTADYVGQLCRSGKVDALLVGRSWYVCKDSIKGHKSTRYRSTQTKSKESIKHELVKEHTPSKVVPKAEYDTDDADLMPVVKKTGFIDVELADAYEVKIKSQVQNYTFKTTELPDIRFKGSLNVTEIEDEKPNDVIPEGAHIIHPTIIRDTKKGDKKAKNIDISDIPVRIITTEVSLRKLTVLSDDPKAPSLRKKNIQKREEEESSRSAFTPIVSFVSITLGCLVVLCLLGLELHISATSQSLTSTYSFDIDHLSASAYSSVEHSKNFLYLVEFSTNVLIF